jgi:hypothetical protein
MAIAWTARKAAAAVGHRFDGSRSMISVGRLHHRRAKTRLAYVERFEIGS